MDVNCVHIPKLTPEEQIHCFKLGLCLHCRKRGHNAATCPQFPSNLTAAPKPKKTREKKLRKVEDLPKLEEIKGDDEDEGEETTIIRKVSFPKEDF